MHGLNFNHPGPKSFILASDGTFSPYRPEDDHVWELDLNPSKTYPFHLTTTYGLRARSMRLFLNIIIGNQRITTTGQYRLLPIVTRYAPASLQVQFQLNNGLEVQFDCFIPQPTVLAGQISITSQVITPIDLSVELAAILSPMGNGRPIHLEKQGITKILTGKSQDLCPVLFMTGGPSTINNPYPALILECQISPDQTQSINWSLATQRSCASSFETAKHYASASWQETNQAYLMKNDSQMIFIQSGNPDWDKAFYLSQIIALTHLINQDNSSPVYLRARLPDQGTDNGTSEVQSEDLSLLETLQLAQVLLPAHVNTFTMVMESILEQLDQNFQAQPAKQNHTPPEIPLLSTLCLEIYDINQDIDFLRQAYPVLSRLIDSWGNHDQDKPGEMLLVWQNLQQCQLSTGLFTFDIWEPFGRGLEIQYAESPALAAMLLNEVKGLKKIAALIGADTAENENARREKTLNLQIRRSWNDDLKTFTYLDRDTLSCLPHQILASGYVQDKLDLQLTTGCTQRLQMHINTGDESPQQCTIRFEGQSADGHDVVEEINLRHIRWVMGWAHLTTENQFKTLQSITIKGLNAEDRYILETVDFSQPDITCFLPLWAGAASQEQIETLLNTCMDGQNPNLKFGIPETWKCHRELPEDLPLRSNVLWNTLIITGLIKQGFPEQAMILFLNLMTSIVRGLKDFNGFYAYYDAQNGLPVGLRNAVAGLAPMRLFLHIAGIRLFTPNRVAVWGTSPFPWPVKIHWHGLALSREGSKTRVTFPDGSSYEHASETAVLLMPSQESGSV